MSSKILPRVSILVSCLQGVEGYMGLRADKRKQHPLTYLRTRHRNSAMLAALPFPNIDPVIFSFQAFGITIALRWYALAYIVGIAIGWQIIAFALRRAHLWRDDVPPMVPEKLEDLLTYIVVGVIAGGLANPIEIPQIWTGGMSFHGGFLGVVLAVYLFSRRHKVPLGSLADVVAIAATPAILLVRCANFINGELSFPVKPRKPAPRSSVPARGILRNCMRQLWKV